MNKSNALYKSRIDKVIDHLNENLDRPVSLSELAAVAFFSPFHFHRIFLAVTGETVKDFTNRSRNEKAARLLRFSNRSIADISIACGFSSVSTLARSFKQYFDVAPGAYRKGAPIENSKIRKESAPINQYPCDRTREELERAFPVEIKKYPERAIAYIRVTDAFREGVVVGAFERIVRWAKDMGLYESQTIFGMSKDDPEVTPKAKYRYEACITLPSAFEINPDSGVAMTTLPECVYAVTRATGDLKVVGEAFNYLFDTWLINSTYECETQPGMEIYLDKENVCNWNHFDLEICIPVKAIKKYSI